MYDGSLRFDTRIDTKGFEKGSASLKASANGLKSAFSGILKTAGLAMAITGLVRFGKESIQLASDLQEVQNVVDVSFGDMAYKCEDFAKTAIQTLGMSELTAKQYSSTYMAMSKGVGLASEQAADMSIEATKRVGDIASFYNKSFEESNTMMKSVWTGETESLKNIGVVMTETNLEAYRLSQGITTAYSAMSQQEKVALRLNFVLDQTKLAEGDFVRTQDSWANQTRMLTENFNQLKITIGTGLIQVLTPVVKVINTLLLQLNTIAQKFMELTAGLFGKQSLSAGTQNATQSVDGLADAEEGLAASTAKANKEAQKSLASFDTINKLDSNKDSSSGSGGASAGGISSSSGPAVADTSSEVSAGVKQTVEKLKGLLEPLKSISFDNLKESLGKLKEAFTPLTKTIGAGLYWIYMNILVPLAKWTIEDVIPAFIDVLSGVFKVLDGVLQGLNPLIDALWKNFLQPVANWTGGVIVNVIEGLATALSKVGDFLKAHPDFVTAAATFLTTALGFGKVKGVATGVFETVTGGIGALIQNGGALKLGIKSLGKSLLGMVPWPALLVAAVFTAIVLIIKNWDKIKAVLGKAKDWLDEHIGTPVKNLFSNIGQWASDAKEAILDKFRSIGQGIKDTLSNAWATVVNIFSAGGKIFNGIKEGIAETFKKVVNTLIKGINFVVSQPFDKINNMLNTLRKVKIAGWSPFEKLWVQNPIKVPAIPYLANGAVIPPNSEFAAILGDQKSGRNLEAPESLIRKIVREESGRKSIKIPVQCMLDGKVLFDTLVEINENDVITTGRSRIKT